MVSITLSYKPQTHKNSMIDDAFFEEKSKSLPNVQEPFFHMHFLHVLLQSSAP